MASYYPALSSSELTTAWLFLESKLTGNMYSSMKHISALDHINLIKYVWYIMYVKPILYILTS